MESANNPYGPPADWVDPQSVTHWRRWAIIAGIVVVLLVGFSWGLDKAAEPVRAAPASTSMQMISEVANLVDEGRGMEALHLMLDEGRERRSVEARLRTQRTRVNGLMRAAVTAMPSTEDQRQLRDLTSALDAYWLVQDQMLALARQGSLDREVASKAKAMLTGQSTRSYQLLVATMERWFARHEPP